MLQGLALLHDGVSKTGFRLLRLDTKLVGRYVN